jgi:DNA-binding PucR family transcriptional regulator
LRLDGVIDLHRNTVSYRINSICRRMDIDVRDFETLRAIQLSDLIARWLRKGSGAFA